MTRRTGSAVIAAILMAPLVVVAGGVPAGAAGTPLYPDLRTEPPRDLRFDRADITPDFTGVFHNVLRFSQATTNDGQGPLIVDAAINPTTRSGPSTQRIMNSDGTSSVVNLNNTVYWHEAHHHYHFDNWGQYQLWTKSAYDAWIASGRTVGAPSYTGAKTTSCITDQEFMFNSPLTPYPGPHGLTGCDIDGANNIHMGLSVGWGDTYPWSRQDQWIDLNQNTLGNGTYVLRSVADPLNFVYESANKADPSREAAPDNESTTQFVVAGGAITDSFAPTGTVSINDVDTTTTTPNVTVKVIGRDDVSGPNQFRLSNNGTSWTTFNYTTANWIPTVVAWNLADAATGGSSANGVHTVYAQVHDISGKWGPTFTDTIDLQAGGPPPPPTPYSQLVKNDGPAGYWRLDETSGTNAADSAGSNPGIYQGGVTLGAPSLLTSDPDKAATFAGTTQRVTVAAPATSPLSLANAISVEAWIKPSAIPAAGAFASVASKPESYALQFNGPQLEFTIMQNGARRRLQAPVGAIVAGNTYHVVGTYDGAAQRLYINGTQVVNVGLTGPITTNSNALSIGVVEHDE